MKYYILGIITATLFSLTACKKAIQRVPTNYKPPVAASTKVQFSSTWITSAASDVLDSRANITKAVATCKASGIDNIFVVVWNQGKTLYPSAIMQSTFGVSIAAKYAGRDPLQEMIEEGHKQNIKVHAWFEYGFASSYSENGGLIIQTKPTWAAKDINGNLVTKNGFDWMNAFLPEVQDFMSSLVMEVVNKYDVDGVQGDDRLPAVPSTAGYDTYTVNLYKAQNAGNAPPTDYKNADWVKFRTDLLSDYLRRLYAMVKAKKPNIVVSSAPSVFPFGRDEYLQDWPTWLDKGYVDLVLPQIYRYDIGAYKSTLAQQLTYLKSKDKSKFYPVMLIQNANVNPSTQFFTDMIDENRKNGFVGEGFWFFEGLKQFPGFFATYNK